VYELFPPTGEADDFFVTPTPDAVRPAPDVRTWAETYVVRPGDSLGRIAGLFGVGPQAILAANGLGNPNILYAGQILTIPAQRVDPPGPSNKILPDSEVIYGPASSLFDLPSYVGLWDSYLRAYAEDVEGRLLSGPVIVQLVAQRYAVNPRLLLALLEYQSGWVTGRWVDDGTVYYPLGFVQAGNEGLFQQLSIAADKLNAGYYLWRAGWNGPFLLADGTSVLPGSGINAGTAAVQHFFAQTNGSANWRHAVGDEGFPRFFASLFGVPFHRAVEPLVPADLEQPELRLPFETGTEWSFTSGPHSAWGVGAAWAALDFAPPGNALGCIPSEEWVLAMADGLILRSDLGEVVQDLDGDGYEQTGWVLLYMHIESRDRVPFGEFVRAGDRIGHPSCEGGLSTGTHVHVARRYNGEWIPADGGLPFVMDGWVSSGAGIEYDGWMTRGDVVLEACGCRAEGNQIWR
jgi:murein DD-endopeptidase MepM/ murein hydrolase activator NlpD